MFRILVSSFDCDIPIRVALHISQMALVWRVHHWRRQYSKVVQNFHRLRIAHFQRGSKWFLGEDIPSNRRTIRNSRKAVFWPDARVTAIPKKKDSGERGTCPNREVALK
jgi:hypothetical protein